MKLQEDTVKFVHPENWTNTLCNCLAEDSFCLYAHTLDAVNHHQSSIRNTKSCCHFGREVNVTRGVDKVNKERNFFLASFLLSESCLAFGWFPLFDGSHLSFVFFSFTILFLRLFLKVYFLNFLLTSNETFLGHAEEKGNTSGFNGDGTVLLILTSVHETGVTSFLLRNNSGSTDKGVGQSGFTVVDVCNDGQTTNVVGLGHHATDLIDSKVYHVDVDLARCSSLLR
mmetsp:Transcript_26515/g.42616  ORF Transcript_26515/g.42616 Transcript_26515/m.42616 type:complete len:227 (-) Transcript_26515:45-725(-)